MKVVYQGRKGHRSNAPSSIAGDVIELLYDEWDDFDYKTTFATVCTVGGESIDLGPIRLLIESEKVSYHHLDKLRKQGWNGEFPIPDTPYISTPSSIAFYQQLDGALGTADAISIAQSLRDASYLVHIADDTDAHRLITLAGFEVSLQRERGSVKAYVDGWKIFAKQMMAVLNLGFRFTDVFSQRSKLELKYQSESPLPHDINVLIGPNGVGKSQVLHQMVKYWLAATEDKDLGFTSKPNLSQLVVVSYSPFEKFPVDLEGYELQDNNAYRYVGFRGRSHSSNDKRPGHIRLTHQFPKKNAAQSLIACLADDQRYRAIKEREWHVELQRRLCPSALNRGNPRGQGRGPAGNGNVLDPSEYVRRGVQPPLEQLPDCSGQ